MPDGSTKKFRRRFISKCNVILKKPPTTTTANQNTPVEMTSSVVDRPVEYEEVELGDDDASTYNPEV